MGDPVMFRHAFPPISISAGELNGRRRRLSPTTVRFPYKKIELEMKLDATAKRPMIRIKNMNEVRIKKMKPLEASTGDGVRLSFKHTANRATVTIKYGSENLGELHLESSRNPRRILSNLLANKIARGTRFSFVAGFFVDRVINRLKTPRIRAVKSPPNAFMFEIEDGASTVRCCIAQTINRLSLSMQYGASKVDELTIETSSDPIKILGNVASHKTGIWLPLVQLVVDTGVGVVMNKCVKPVALLMVDLMA